MESANSENLKVGSSQGFSPVNDNPSAPASSGNTGKSEEVAKGRFATETDYALDNPSLKDHNFTSDVKNSKVTSSSQGVLPNSMPKPQNKVVQTAQNAIENTSKKKRLLGKYLDVFLKIPSIRKWIVNKHLEKLNLSGVLNKSEMAQFVSYFSKNAEQAKSLPKSLNTLTKLLELAGKSKPEEKDYKEFVQTAELLISANPGLENLPIMKKLLTVKDGEIKPRVLEAKDFVLYKLQSVEKGKDFEGFIASVSNTLALEEYIRAYDKFSVGESTVREVASLSPAEKKYLVTKRYQLKSRKNITILPSENLKLARNRLPRINNDYFINSITSQYKTKTEQVKGVYNFISNKSYNSRFKEFLMSFNEQDFKKITVNNGADLELLNGFFDIMDSQTNLKDERKAELINLISIISGSDSKLKDLILKRIKEYVIVPEITNKDLDKLFNDDDVQELFGSKIEKKIKDVLLVMDPDHVENFIRFLSYNSSRSELKETIRNLNSAARDSNESLHVYLNQLKESLNTLAGPPKLKESAKEFIVQMKKRFPLT